MRQWLMQLTLTIWLKTALVFPPPVPLCPVSIVPGIEPRAFHVLGSTG